MGTKLFKSKAQIVKYLKGTKDFEGVDGEELMPYIQKILIDKDDGVNVEISPVNKRIHAHIVLEVQHTARIGVDQNALKEAMAEHLPAHLKPETGGAYVFVKLIPATLRYTRKGEVTEKMSIATLQARMLNRKKNGGKLIHASKELGIIEEDFEL